MDISFAFWLMLMRGLVCVVEFFSWCGLVGFVCVLGWCTFYVAESTLSILLLVTLCGLVLEGLLF